MNIGEEKEHIYAMMRDITTERRKLSEMYFSLKERLDELNKLEVRGLEDLSIKGYVDLFNQQSREVAVTNVERETSHVIKKLKDLPRPKGEEKVVGTTLIKEEEIERLDKPAKPTKKPKKRNGYLNLEKVESAIANVLKGSEVPLSTKELYEKVTDKLDATIVFNNFRNNIIPRAMKKNKKIDKAHRGYYQYNTNG